MIKVLTLFLDMKPLYAVPFLIPTTTLIGVTLLYIALPIHIARDTDVPINGVNGTAGIKCWDLNSNGVCDLTTEDINADGNCTVADCIGPRGISGTNGTGGINGTNGKDGTSLKIDLRANLNEAFVADTQANHSISGVLVIAVTLDNRVNMSIPAGIVGNQTGNLIAFDGTSWGSFGSVTGIKGDVGPRGFSCWDLNQNGVCDLVTEDKNADGNCTVADCKGAQGANGTQGTPGTPAVTKLVKAFYTGAPITQNAGTATTIPFTNAGINDDGMWNAGSPTLITFSVTGWFFMTWNIGMSGTSGVTFYEVDLVYGGGATCSSTGPYIVTQDTRITGSCLIHAGSGSTAILQVSAAGSASYTIVTSGDSVSLVAMLVRAG